MGHVSDLERVIEETRAERRSAVEQIERLNKEILILDEVLLRLERAKPATPVTLSTQSLISEGSTGTRPKSATTLTVEAFCSRQAESFTAEEVTRAVADAGLVVPRQRILNLLFTLTEKGFIHRIEKGVYIYRGAEVPKEAEVSEE